jgi:hypothetical protein
MKRIKEVLGRTNHLPPSYGNKIRRSSEKKERGRKCSRRVYESEKTWER